MGVLKIFLILIPVLLGVAFFTLFERKLLSIIGTRFGPNKVSYVGVLQPIGDAVKLANKQINSLFNLSFFFYYASSIFMILMGILLWFTLFNLPVALSFKFGFLVLFLILGFNSLNSILSGWSTFGKYSLIGSIRTVSQLISYEAVLYVCIFFFIFLSCSFSLNFFSFIPLDFLCLFMPFLFMIWFPSFLAELNRTPYDFSEGESELVSGFNTDFGSISFTLIFLAEYSSIMFFCFLTCILFFKGLEFIFFVMFFYVVWIRSVLPRFRFDKLMMVSWKFLVPFSTFLFLWLILEIFYF